jgi:hypothetical protein
MNLDMGLEEGKDKIDSFYITPNYVLGSISHNKHKRKRSSFRRKEIN